MTIDTKKLRRHVNSQSTLRAKSNSVGLDFDASLNLDVAKELLDELDRLKEKREADKYVINSLAKNIADISKIVGFNGEESDELVEVVKQEHARRVEAEEVVKQSKQLSPKDAQGNLRKKTSEVRDLAEAHLQKYQNPCKCTCHKTPTPREKGTICKTGCPDCGYSIIEGIAD